jgi:hypothetical protein
MDHFDTYVSFYLVHIPGAFHGPDGLSRRRAQPGDVEEKEDDFDDWIDQVHSFLHMILPISNHIVEQPPATVYMLSGSLTRKDDDDDVYDEHTRIVSNPTLTA